jgi:hypothetical protein
VPQVSLILRDLGGRSRTHLLMLKLTLLVKFPAGVATTTAPVVAPAGTTADMYVSLTTLNFVAPTPLNVTLVVPVALGGQFERNGFFSTAIR